MPTTGLFEPVQYNENLLLDGNVQDDVFSVYYAELNRPPDAAGLAAKIAFVNSGGTVAQYRQAVASSPEAQAMIAADYIRILGRLPDATGAAGFTQFLATAPTDQLQGAIPGTNIYENFYNYAPTITFLLANSDEAQADIASIYQAELGRAPDVAGATAYTAALVSSPTTSLASIRAGIAGSAEAQSHLTMLYQSELGRQPDAAGLAGNTLYLANGGSLANLRTAFAHSAEIAADIKQAYQASGVPGYQPDLANQAAASELLSGVPFADLKAELGQLSGGPPPVDPNLTVQVALTNGVASLLNDDFLFKSPVDFLPPSNQSATGTVTDAFASGGSASITGFNTANDVLFFQGYQANGAGTITAAPSASGMDTILTPTGGGMIDLVGVRLTSLTASNFVIGGGVVHPSSG